MYTLSGVSVYIAPFCHCAEGSGAESADSAAPRPFLARDRRRADVGAPGGCRDDTGEDVVPSRDDAGAGCRPVASGAGSAALVTPVQCQRLAERRRCVPLIISARLL